MSTGSLTSREQNALIEQIAQGHSEADRIAFMIKRKARLFDPNAHHAADFYLKALNKLDLTPEQISSLYYRCGSTDQDRLRGLLATLCLWANTEIGNPTQGPSITRDRILRFINKQPSFNISENVRYWRATFASTR